MRQAAGIRSLMHSRPYGSSRLVSLALTHLLWAALGQISSASALPVSFALPAATTAQDGKPPDDPSLWLYLGVATALVLSGGAFAGLTIALMGQVSTASTLLWHSAGVSKQNSDNWSSRMKYISKLSRPLVKAPKRNTQRRCLIF